MSTGFSGKTIEPLPAFADILNDQEKFGGEGDDFSTSINNWFDKLMIQSGTGMSPSMLLALCLLIGVTVGGMLFIFQENLLSSALLGTIGAAVPVLVMIFLRDRRQKQMMQQLPAMIDELARAAKTGRSVEQCWAMVAHDTSRISDAGSMAACCAYVRQQCRNERPTYLHQWCRADCG